MNLNNLEHKIILTREQWESVRQMHAQDDDETAIECILMWYGFHDWLTRDIAVDIFEAAIK